MESPDAGIPLIMIEDLGRRSSRAADEISTGIQSSRDETTTSAPQSSFSHLPADEYTDNPECTPEMRVLLGETPVPDDIRVAGSTGEHSNISRLRRFHWWWFWELGGITISVCCMVAILVLLPYLDNRPLNDWQFLMAPNTMISTFITVAKTSMLLAVAEGISQLKWHYFKIKERSLRELDLFDAASRGPWGAFIFIIRMAGKPGTLFAMIGAFVVVATLTMEPFAQQILSFESRRVNSAEGLASFSIRRVWDDTIGNSKGQQSMESAFMRGLVGSPAGFQYSCSGDNCTWPDFSALGICASCNNITEGTTIVLEVVSQFNASEDVALDGNPDDCQDILYITPAGIMLRMSTGCSYTYRDHWSPGCGSRTAVQLKSTVALNPYRSIHSRTTLQNRNPLSPRLPFPTSKPISTWDFLSTTSRASIETARATQINTSATMATLFNRAPSAKPVCQATQTLPTSIAGGAKWSNFKDEVSNSTIVMLAISQVGVTRNGFSGRISGNASITECQLNWCEKVFRNVQVTDGVLEPFDVTDKQLNESQLSNNIEYLKSWVKGGRKSSLNVPDVWRYVADQMTFTIAADGNPKFGPGSVMSDAVNIQEVIEKVAEALTHQMYLGNGSFPQNGTAHVQEVFVVVRWQWAVFPMVLVLLGIIFLTANVWINSHDDVFLWKSSLLPLLFHGLDGFDPEILDVDKSSEMTEAAKQMYARLEKNDAGSTKLVST